MSRVTKEELLEKIFGDDYENLKGKRLRMTRVRVPAKEVCLAHVLTPSDACIYQNLALHIGVHEGEDHTGQTLGMIRFTPWEAVVAAADMAVKGTVDIAGVEAGLKKLTSVTDHFKNGKTPEELLDLLLGDLGVEILETKEIYITLQKRMNSEIVEPEIIEYLNMLNLEIFP